MQIDIITLFPQMFAGPFSQSILQRIQKKSLVKIKIHDLRDFAIDDYGTVDDRPYGGGAGMILRIEPIAKALKSIKKKKKSKIILLSPSGTPFVQKKALNYSRLDQLILICGHYEGVDQRVADDLVDEVISIGDYVLTGGEIPAMVIVDTVIRLIPQAFKKKGVTEDESFSQGLLEYPQYTRPENYQGKKVPQVLLSGNHQKIEKWKREKAKEKTQKLRPDLLC